MSDIETIVDDVPATSKAKPKAVVEQAVTIMIPSTEKDQGDVFVGVNGRTFLIQRDHPVTVPKYIYEHLRDARETVYNSKTGEARLVASYNVTMA